MWWLGAASAASSLIGMSSANKAASQAKETGRLNASLIRQEGAEEERRLLRSIKQTDSLTKAITGASGVDMSGSRLAAFEDAKKENLAQLDWLKKSTESREKAALAGASNQSSQLKSQALSSGFSALSSTATSLWGKGGLLT